MKRTLLFIHVLFFTTFSALAQVADIGVKFTRRGHILELGKGSIIAYFVEKGEASIEKFSTKTLASITIDGKSSKIEQLRTGMEIVLIGDFFETTQSIEAHKISVTTQTGKSVSIENGRLDIIRDGYGYADGHRVKLAPKTKITGVKKSGYEDKSFDSFSELKLGDIINVSGKYHEDGYILANKVTIEPETKTEADQYLEDTALAAKFRTQYYDTWSDPAKRHTMFGMYLPTGMTIAKDAALQDYVNKLGQSLIPSHIKNKHKFMFIAQENWSVQNAYMSAAGICYVNTLSLCTWFENEAQLAAVLGHEITHFIYKHIAGRMKEVEKMQEKAEKREEASRKRNNFITNVGPVVTIRNQNGGVIFQQKVGTKTLDILTKDLANARDIAKYSDYSIENETQCDRVGLTLMAQAGYDVREAPLVWVKKINIENEELKKIKARNGGELPKQAEAPPNKQYSSLNEFSANIINTSLLKKAEKYNQRLGNSHPEKLTRIEDLNKLISQYYFNPETLENAVVGEDRYLTIINGYKKVKLAEIKKMEAVIAANKKKRAELNKQFTAALPKQKQRLQTLTKPLLTYKGYTIRSVVNASAFIKPSCQFDEINDEIGRVHSYIESIKEPEKSLGKLDQWVKDFKSYKNENDKDWEFALYYAKINKIHESLIKMAASASICDVENVETYNPVNNENFPREVVEEAVAFYELLKKKKE